ncbi:MAG: hypothetical protein HZA13_07855 [Nitrospirae bacterium]|nr:hypothetical protein [Nitrospirota bacterium]
MVHKGRSLFLILVSLVLGLGIKPLLAADGVTLVYDYIRDSNHKTFLDKSIRIDYGQAYAIGFLGNWQKGGEVGGYFLDYRKSSYGSYVRIRELDESYQLSTEQVLTKGYVAKLQVRYIHIDEPEKPTDKKNLFVYGVGFDKYYGDYNYLSAMYYNDPRESGRFSLIISNTFATKNSYLRLGITPRSDRTVGYFAITKYHWVFFGYSFTRDFDFATFDRRAVTFGLQIPFDLVWSQ